MDEKMTKWNDLIQEQKIEVIRYNFSVFTTICYLFFTILSIFGVLISTLMINSNILYAIAIPLLIVSIILTAFFSPLFLLKTYEIIRIKREVFKDGK